MSLFLVYLLNTEISAKWSRFFVVSRF